MPPVGIYCTVAEGCCVVPNLLLQSELQQPVVQLRHNVDDCSLPAAAFGGCILILIVPVLSSWPLEPTC